MGKPVLLGILLVLGGILGWRYYENSQKIIDQSIAADLYRKF